jgi:hypothetical protein
MSPRPARSNRLAECEPLAVGRSKRQLTHAPRLVLRGLAYLRARGDGSRVKRVNVIDTQIRDIAVIAKFARRRNVWATTEHEDDLARATNRQLPGATSSSSHPRTSRYHAPERSRVVHRQNGVGARDPVQAFSCPGAASASGSSRSINGRRHPRGQQSVSPRFLRRQAPKQTRRYVTPATPLPLRRLPGRRRQTAPPIRRRPRAAVRRDARGFGVAAADLGDFLSASRARCAHATCGCGSCAPGGQVPASR